MIAAVPQNIGQYGFDSAPPGHRFNLYFEGWNKSTWAKVTDTTAVLKNLFKLPSCSVEQIKALRQRQQRLCHGMNETQCWHTEAVSVAPLMTGMGLDHPLENGFAFLTPYGLPYLPGSSIKGVLRQAAGELGTDEAIVTALFGYEANAENESARQGALCFMDSLPHLYGDTLTLDIMTPHHSGYYKGEASPHDSELPIPLPFLVIPPQSKFTFQVTAQPSLLPEPLRQGAWKITVADLFDYAFEWLGFGAKTALGYGAMEEDTNEISAQIEENRAYQKKIVDDLRVRSLPPVQMYMEKYRSEWEKDNGQWVERINACLDVHSDIDTLSLEVFKGLMEEKWKGILKNPEAVQGKKKKAKYKEKPKALAKRLLSLSP